jgi:TPR repeat protein
MGDATYVLELPTPDGTTRFHAEWRGLRPKGVAEDVAQAERRYERACELGDARACFYQAALLPSDDPRRLGRSTTACEAGLAHACALALAASGLRPNPALLAQAEPALRAACEAGDAAACNGLGVALHLRGDTAGARTALDGACQAKVEPACRNLLRAQ